MLEHSDAIATTVVGIITMVAAAVGGYVGVLKAISALRLEFVKEINRRDVVLEAHGQRIKGLEEDIKEVRGRLDTHLVDGHRG